MENHYKDGTWRYPEFAQPEDIFLEIVEQIDSPFFGVQYDPSNAFVGGYDPDPLPREGAPPRRDDARLGSLSGAGRDAGRPQDRRRRDRYAAVLKHGETGKGLNDYDAIFRLLAERGFSGWISLEDGMNGLDEMRRSVEFLKRKRAEHWPQPLRTAERS